MNQVKLNLLDYIFILDATLAIGFGLYSWLFPFQTFGSFIAIPELHSSVFLSLFSSLSMFYLLVGLTCLLGLNPTFQIKLWVSLLMLLRHLIEGIIKWRDIGKDWLIGNPYPDIVIHLLFVFAYVLAIFILVRSSRLQLQK